MSGVGALVSTLAKSGPEVLEVADGLVKLGAASIQAIDAWMDGKGPEPAALAELPETSKSSLALARMERLAATGKADG